MFVCTLICVLVDPFNVFHPLCARNTYCDPNKNYIKMTYILSTPEKYDAFLFGSSRVGTIHSDRITGEHCYNMTYAGGCPREHLDNLRTMISHGVLPKHIYVGVDTVSYVFSSRREREQNLMTSPYELSLTNPFRFWVKYLNPNMIGNYLRTTVLNSLGADTSLTDMQYQTLYTTGWFCDYGYNHFSMPYYSDAQVEEIRNMTMQSLEEDDLLGSSDYAEMCEALDAIEQISKLCEENAIDLTVFVNPLFADNYPDAVLHQRFLVFLRELAQVVPCYYNFSGFNSFTMNSQNYMDNNHLSAEASDVLVAFFREKTCRIL